jgi:hypothetical protein
MNDAELVVFLIEKGKAWASAQRDHHHLAARPLTLVEKHALASFFDGRLLDAVRVRRVPLITNPEFYLELARVGLPMPLDFNEMSGITFLDTVLISERHHPQDPPAVSLLFHELVHAVQYQLLGRDAFVERYVCGWAENAFDYFSIPLERDAYELETRYDTSPATRFCVEAEVRRQLRLG